MVHSNPLHNMAIGMNYNWGNFLDQSRKQNLLKNLDNKDII